MSIEEIKIQMEVVVKIFLTLSIEDRLEAIVFLKDYITRFETEYQRYYNVDIEPKLTDRGLVPVAETPVEKSPTNGNLSEFEECTTENAYEEEFQNSPLDFSDVRTDVGDINNVDICKKVPNVQKRSRRKQLSTRKSIRKTCDTISKSSANVKICTDSKSVNNNVEHNNYNRNNPLLIKKEVLNKRLKKLYSSKKNNSKIKLKVQKFQCPECLLSFDSKDVLLEHFKSHNKDFYSCKMCIAKFSDILKFWKHKKFADQNCARYSCNECEEKFKHRRHYLKHMTGHRDNNCQYCNEKLSTVISYKAHVEKCHPDIKLTRELIPCKFCSKGFLRLPSLYNHYRLKHSRGKFVCLYCGLFLSTKDKYKEHSLIHENEKNWKCDICDMKFYRRQQYRVHIKIHKAGTYKCLTCNLSVTSWKLLYKNHKLNGHEVVGLEPKYECNICNKKFTRRFNMQDHMSLHTKSTVFSCEPCGKEFRTMVGLKKHEKTMKHQKTVIVVIPESQYEKIYQDKFICESCGKQYNTNQELLSHLRIHKRYFKCEQCRKTFSLKFNLDKHLKIHHKSEEYVCEKCGDTLKSLPILQQHNLYKHSDLRPAKCEVCGNSFKRKSELNRHMKFHANTRPFVCFCGEAYKLATHLKKHKLKVHSKNIDLENYDQNYLSSNSDLSKNVLGNNSSLLLKALCKTSEDRNLLNLDNLNITKYRNDMNHVSPNYIHDIQTDVKDITPSFTTGTDSMSDSKSLVFSSSTDMSVVPMHNNIAVIHNNIPNHEENNSAHILNLNEHIVEHYETDHSLAPFLKHPSKLEPVTFLDLQNQCYTTTESEISSRALQALNHAHYLDTDDPTKSYGHSLNNESELVPFIVNDQYNGSKVLLSLNQTYNIADQTPVTSYALDQTLLQDQENDTTFPLVQQVNNKLEV